MAFTFEINGRALPRDIEQRMGYNPNLQVIAKMHKGTLVVVDNSKRIEKTSMALFHGFLVPKNIRPDELLRTEEIVAKFSSRKERDELLSLEKGFLHELSGMKGVSSVICDGKADVYYEDRRSYFEPANFTRRQVPFFVMPKIEGETLSAFALPKWDTHQPTRESLALLAVKILPALTERLSQLHGRQMVHRDVKPENALYDRAGDFLSVIDFERSGWIAARRVRTDGGAYGYLSPEIFLGKPERHDVRTDVYALGVTSLELLTGQRGVIYGNMPNPWGITGFDSRIFSFDGVMREYYTAIAGLGSASIDVLVDLIHMPPELKHHPLGRYLVALMHPSKEYRPSNMAQIAQDLRRYGTRLETHFAGQR